MLITSADVKARISLRSSRILSSDSQRCHMCHAKSFGGYFFPHVSLCVEDDRKFWVDYQWTHFRHLKQLGEKSSRCKMLNLRGVCWCRVNLISKGSLQSAVLQHLFQHSSVRVRRCAKWSMLTHWGHFSQIIVECANCSTHTENLIYTGRTGAPWA